MVKIGEKFRKYEPLGIKHIAIPDTGSENEAKFLSKYEIDKNELPEMMPTIEPYAFKTTRGKIGTFRVLTKSRSLPNLKNVLDKTVVSVAPTAHVYPIPEDKIPQDQKSLEASKDTFSAFNYYVVEHSVK